MWRPWASALLDTFFPPVCAACASDTDGPALCVMCEVFATAPLPDAPAPPPLTSWTAAVAYEGAARDWIRRFKFPRPGMAALDPAADAVARDWIQRAARAVPSERPALVVPVPLHNTRLRERGFNQSASLARDAARAVGSKADSVALRRTRATSPQAELGRRARKENVRGAFDAQRTIPGCVWLVDDIATTGATLAAAAQALRSAGAREVHAVTLAWRPWIR